jgi:predicted RNase H-like nuclease
MMKTNSVARAVLGIDAAWTETQPSGVALVVDAEGGWRLAAVEASYDHFLARASGDASGEERPRGSKPNAATLLGAANKFCGRRVDLVAVDMPMSREQIRERRCCDDKISVLYGKRKAATHSPGADRPGIISGPLRGEFENEKYNLCTHRPAEGLIEVYPHTALIEFLNAPCRLKYKVGKIAAYWPDLCAEDRHEKLRAVWWCIVETLERRIAGVSPALAPPDPTVRGWRLKAYEDKLDAVICCAVAIAALNGSAEAHGDHNAAIWVPFGAPTR